METKTSCLIVDDNQSVQAVLKEVLEDTGEFKMVVSAFDGTEAITKVNNQEFGLIIVDINMPKMGGLEVINTLKKEKLNRNAKIMIISGNLDSKNVKTAVSLGVKNFMVKPFSNDEFVEKVLSVLKS